MTGQNIVTDIFSLEFQFELVFRLIISCLAGALVGYERKRRQKEAGMRTHIMVALASAIFAIVSKYGFFDVVVLEGISLDASRISSSIVTGIAFLGAGMIFVKFRSITGLTTAAGIWAVAGIGMAFGSGVYTIGIAATLLIVVIQYFLHGCLQKVEGSSTKEITIVIDNSDNIMDEFVQEMKKVDAGFYFTEIEKRENNVIKMRIGVKFEEGRVSGEMWNVMKDRPYISSISL